VTPVACTKVSTAVDPEGTPHPISLKECIALALENGRVGGTNIRVLAYDPATTYTNIEEALARFDARWVSTMSWNVLDEPIGNVLNSLPLGVAPTVVPTATGVGTATSVGVAGTAAVNNIVGSVNNIEAANFTTRLEKLLPTGGLAGITFRTDYTLVNQPPVVGQLNPTYRPRLVFDVEQPLLRGAGVTANQTGILVARLTFDQERQKFCASVNQLLFEVEQAYWDLYFSYWSLHTLDLALQQAHDAWQAGKLLRDKELMTVQDLAALELQYQQLRLARLDAVGGATRSVLESERKLRFVVGLPPEDGCRLIPTDTPSTAPCLPNWCASLGIALDKRPELVQLRQEVKKIGLAIKQAKNQTLPDLRAVASYDINGIGDRLDGPSPDNAFRDLASNHFHDWTLGLTLDVPIGARAAHAQLRRAELQLAARMTQLRDQEKQATFALQQSYRELVQASEVVRIQAAIAKAATERYQALYEKFRAGVEGAGGPTFLLIAQQQWIAALTSQRAGVFSYNLALAKFELEKGTIQQYDNVSISEGPLPPCAAERASAHISEMTRAHILRERPGPAALGCPSCVPGPADGPPSIANLEMGQAPAAAPPQAPATVNARPAGQQPPTP
jgi:outer membrane protein TolC